VTVTSTTRTVARQALGRYLTVHVLSDRATIRNDRPETTEPGRDSVRWTAFSVQRPLRSCGADCRTICGAAAPSEMRRFKLKRHRGRFPIPSLEVRIFCNFYGIKSSGRLSEINVSRVCTYQYASTFRDCVNGKLSLSCRRWTRGTCCVTAVVLYTKVDAYVINWRRSSRSN